jgi:hypothetical protein
MKSGRQFVNELHFAANKAVEEFGYSGSADALAIKSAFTVGGNTAAQFQSASVLLSAFREGRKWALAEDTDSMTEEQWTHLYRKAGLGDVDAAKQLPLSEWAESRRHLMTPQTIAENSKIHRREG